MKAGLSIFMVFAVLSLSGCGVLNPITLTGDAIKELNIDKDEMQALLSDQHAFWSFAGKLAKAQQTKVEIPYGMISLVESYRAQGLPVPAELAKANIFILKRSIRNMGFSTLLSTIGKSINSRVPPISDAITHGFPHPMESVP